MSCLFAPSRDLFPTIISSTPTTLSTTTPVAAAAPARSNSGVIAGATIGGIAVIVLAVFLFLFLQRQRQHHADILKRHDEKFIEQGGSVTPFVPPSSPPATPGFGQELSYTPYSLDHGSGFLTPLPAGAAVRLHPGTPSTPGTPATPNTATLYGAQTQPLIGKRTLSHQPVPLRPGSMTSSSGPASTAGTTTTENTNSGPPPYMPR